MDTLALTDRDGLYGAVRFVLACQAAHIRPVLGLDLALDPAASNEWPIHSAFPGGTGSTSRRRTPARGGAFADTHDRSPADPRAPYPRITLLARDRRGWASLCQLVSATHLAGERGRPVCTPALLADHLGGSDAGGLTVLLGPASD